MDILLSVLIFSSQTVTTFSLRLPCQQKMYPEGIIKQNAIEDGEALACLSNLGLDMCGNMCERTTNCAYVEHDSDTLLCCLIKNKTFSSDVSNCIQSLPNSTERPVDMDETTVCGQFCCPEAATCISLKPGGHLCVDIIDLIKECAVERYLVTGKYGVLEDRMNFSSVYNNRVDYRIYQIHGGHGWLPHIHDQDQWIQVLFYRRKLVVGIITRGNSNYNAFVSEYRLRYLSMSQNWKDVRNESGNIIIFPGNINGSTKKTNYLSHPIRTSGVRLLTVSWNVAIMMGFDVIGC